MKIDYSDPDWKKNCFEKIKENQCAGAQIFKSNVGINTGAALREMPAEITQTFASYEEFVAHHAEVPIETAKRFLMTFTPEQCAENERNRAGVQLRLVKREA
jgi:hypothetical protein